MMLFAAVIETSELMPEEFRKKVSVCCVNFVATTGSHEVICVHVDDGVCASDSLSFFLLRQQS